MARMVISILLVIIDQVVQHPSPEASPQGNNIIPSSD